MDAEYNNLFAIYRSESLADRSQYINIDSDKADEMTKAINIMKLDPPLYWTPIIPNQSLVNLIDTDHSFEGDEGEALAEG